VSHPDPSPGEAERSEAEPAAAPVAPVAPARRDRSVWLFAAGLALYLATRLIHLEDFPAFFFCDEAIQANTAADLVHAHFRDKQGVLLPGYFPNDERRALSLNVYLLTAPVTLFGKSIVVTRGTFVAVSALGAAALGIALRVAGVGVWWAGPFLLAALPMDFLHSRWAMETTPACYAGFVCAYLLYRLRSPRYVFLALAMAAATFYSYTAGQGIVLVMGILLLVTDARYHFRQSPARLAAAFAFVLVLAFPAWREHRLHPGTTMQQLSKLGSYWVRPLPLPQKLRIFGHNYLTGFQPRYWFFPNEYEMMRHRVDHLAFVPLILAPFLLIGIVACVFRCVRSPAHRVILLSPLGVPFAAAAHERQMLRLLPMAVPIVLLTLVGVDELRRLLGRWLPSPVLAAGLAGGLTVATVRLCTLSFTDSASWFSEYGLYGMQWGARQVTDAAKAELLRSPGSRVHISSGWANNPETFLDFFFRRPLRERVQLGELGPYLSTQTAPPENVIFVMTPQEFERNRRDPKLEVLEPPIRVLNFPNGQPGFYFVRVRYSKEADTIFAAEREQRKILQEGRVDSAGVIVRHSWLDMGNLPDLFDGDKNTLIRGLEANPFVLEFVFPEPRRMAHIDVRVGEMEGYISIEVTPASGAATLRQSKPVARGIENTQQSFALGGRPIEVSKIRMEVGEPGKGEPDHLEIREVAFQ
jgi:hypothetical protein